MKIAIITHTDLAQGAQRFAEALARHTSYDIRYVNKTHKHSEYVAAVKGADVVWVSGDYPMSVKADGLWVNQYSSSMAHGLPIARGAAIISSPCGSFFRRKIEGSMLGLDKYKRDAFSGNCDLMAPLSPDLNYPDLDGIWMRHAWDNDGTPNYWENHKHLIIGAYIGHNMYNDDTKGVKKHLLPAIDILRKEGHNIEARISERADHYPQDKFIDMIRGCTVYYDQITPIGIYACCGIQAMSSGIPVIASITKTAEKQAQPFDNYASPCLRAHDTGSLVELLRGIILGKIDLAQASRESHKYAAHAHGYESVAEHATHIINVARKRHGAKA